VLEIRQLHKSYTEARGEVHALQDIDLDLAAGDFVAVQGPSGSGKSTLLLVVGGLLAPTAGRVVLDGRDLYALSPLERARLRATAIGFVFQQFHLIPYLSVRDNVLAPSLAMAAQGQAERASELISHFGLEARAHHRPAQLSVGERQRTALARALLNRPRLLLADEPTGNLDEENARIVSRYLAEFAENGGAVLLVTHAGEVARYARRIVRLEDGRLLPHSGEPGS
jgi:ABC-type lipoprotein export system ATPase subunit